MKTNNSYVKLLHVFFLIIIFSGTGFSQIAQDCLGGSYIKDQFVVQFSPIYGHGQRYSVRAKHNAVLLDSCVCDYGLEVWDVSNSYPNMTIEEKQGHMGSSIEIESVDFNYVINLPPNSPSLGSMLLPKGHNPTQVKVAIIDTGVDRDHIHFQAGGPTTSIFFDNVLESIGSSTVDDDGNCLVDDKVGYNFYNGQGDPNEKQLDHGSHVAGIADMTSVGTMEIMDLKVFGDKLEFNTLYNATCATYYAIQKEARVINMSWGWNGLPALCLKKAIKIAGEKNCALVVCSAGNLPQSVDLHPHYPSGFGLDNIIEVTAMDVDNNHQLTNYASYGKNVDIAAQGNWISLSPKNQVARKDGTSMAAAAITGLAARLYDAKPQATYHEVKDAIINVAPKHNYWPEGRVKDNRYLDFNDKSVVQNALTYISGVVNAAPCEAPTVTCDNIAMNICTFLDEHPNHPILKEDCDNGGIANYIECKFGGNPHSPCDDCEVAIKGVIDICTIINGDINHPLAKKDCDKDGVNNFNECKLGSDPLDFFHVYIVKDCVQAVKAGVDICSLIDMDINHPIAKEDCDKGGASNYYECLIGTDPSYPKDDCTGCGSKQITTPKEVTPTPFVVSPNPFSTEVTIAFNLEADSPIAIQIMDISGKRIFSYRNDFQQGQHSVQWNGEMVPSGIYIVHLETNNFVQTKRLVK